MKKTFTLFAFLFSLAALNAQTSLQCWSLNSGQTSTVTAIANGDTITYLTIANTLKSVPFRFKNTSASTNTYSVRRTDLTLNSGAVAEFGFGDLGTNFVSGITTPPSSADYSVLLAGASTATGVHLYPKLTEGPSPGVSYVRYKLFNVATGEFGPDTLTFTVRYILDIPQTLQAWTTDAAGTTTLIPLTNGIVISYTTAASSPTLTSTQTVKIRYSNMSSSVTHTYSVLRTDIAVNQASPGAIPYFCFGDLGTCYSTFALEPNPGDYSILSPGAYSVPGKQLITDLDEAYTIGYSEVNYKLFELNIGMSGPDTLSWTIKYNQILSVNENTSILESASNIYPNPSTNNANITVVLTDEVPVKVQVFNSLGSLIYNGAEQQLNGKNKLAVDCTNFNNGLYFMTVTAGNAKVTKRLVVNK